ncbi:hypothetical protein IQ230_15075 [Gloeocapsopsis crepidinum LEGE 06123]|uniref:Uncharacterized protein n=1 Tax=Gloeocapsopsis crepidinum LEGE 06123 TaxID=588587 RepID=A0ABR9UTP8_9CHRO|nr:hypothetical protein [Gloeocapsopsis crepidinum]MBE9191646.1 hypothetical protein [Gloeocapsopsis crepidinum LEGE 06123]
MFIQNLIQVTNQLRRAQLNNCIQEYILCGIEIWCKQLFIDQNVADYIVKNYKEWGEIQDITAFSWSEWQPKKREVKNIFGQITEEMPITSRLNYLITRVLKRININSGNMVFIALITFAVTAVGYLLYKSNQPEQKNNFTETTKNDNNNYSNPPIQKIDQHFLVLAVDAKKASLIQSLKNKEYISLRDGEEIYDATQYLWLGSESTFNQKKSNMKKYRVLSGEESEYDIYLLYLKLSQSDEGFEPNLNQLARYDAFRKLADLTIDFEISPRLQMEACTNFELYSR